MDNSILKNKNEDIRISEESVAAENTAEPADAVYGATEKTPDYVLRQKTFRYKSYLFFKRAFDIFVSGLAIILLSWLLLILAIVVKVSDGGSVFFTHKRVGKNGKEIKIAKFRSMKKDADKLNDSLSVEEVEDYKKEYKLDNDPRITKVGKFLRKTSLDELPNLFAVFSGKISIVGPRPLLRCEVYEKYGKDADKLLSVKPGMTGWWAVNGRNGVSYLDGERQRLELYYVDRCSLWFDFKIMIKTVFCVFKRKGAK